MFNYIANLGRCEGGRGGLISPQTECGFRFGVQLPYGKALAAHESTWRKQTYSLGKKLQGNLGVTQLGMT